MNLRRFFYGFAFLLLVISPAGISQAGVNSPEAFVKEMASRTMGAIASPDITREERRAIFRDMLDDHFDMATISRFVLGRYWRVASAEQKKRYRTLLDEALINVYTDRFDDYKGEGFEVLGQRAEGRLLPAVLDAGDVGLRDAGAAGRLREPVLVHVPAVPAAAAAPWLAKRRERQYPSRRRRAGPAAGRAAARGRPRARC